MCCSHIKKIMYDLGKAIRIRQWLSMVEREGITMYKHTSNLVYSPSLPPTYLLLNHLKSSQPSNSESLKLIMVGKSTKKITSILHTISRLFVLNEWDVRSYTITPFLHLVGLMTRYSYQIKHVLTRKTSSMYPRSGIWMLNLDSFTPNYLSTMHLHN